MSFDPEAKEYYGWLPTLIIWIAVILIGIACDAGIFIAASF